jgi:electron transfer flavoprotein beta subunit
LRIIVFVKWVPAPEGTPELGPEHRLRREGVEGALDPGDEYGVEAALQLAEPLGGEVTVVSMGPEVALAAVQRALAMGADRGILVTDDALVGADALVTARVLAAVTHRLEAELVIAAVESTDGYTGTMPVTVAELLDLPAITFVTKLEVVDATIRADRQTPTGYEVVACELPALVTLTAGANEPRFPSLKGTMAARSKPVEQLSVADLGIEAREVRTEQRVVSMEPTPAKSGGEIVAADEAGLERIIDLLVEAKVIG